MPQVVESLAPSLGETLQIALFPGLGADRELPVCHPCRRDQGMPHPEPEEMSETNLVQVSRSASEMSPFPLDDREHEALLPELLDWRSPIGPTLPRSLVLHRRISQGN